jgi:hypothetical protein
MGSNGYKKAFDSLAETYLSLDESAETIARQLKKSPKAYIRGKLVRELRNLEKMRLELLDQRDNPAKLT